MESTKPQVRSRYPLAGTPSPLPHPNWGLELLNSDWNPQASRLLDKHLWRMQVEGVEP
ncbi:MAG: hypothetical protein IGQ88_11810 [Gloeomargaritaceae cyanobacterium C42_A2020_066]|nr:hypothetical protein [Gloeomargaritaceae cyanobacterium C42_A2020_066]